MGKISEHPSLPSLQSLSSLFPPSNPEIGIGINIPKPKIKFVPIPIGAAYLSSPVCVTAYRITPRITKFKPRITRPTQLEPGGKPGVMTSSFKPLHTDQNWKISIYLKITVIRKQRHTQKPCRTRKAER